MGVVQDPYWLERGHRDVAADTTTGGQATTLPMTEEQLAAAKAREQTRPPVGFTSPPAPKPPAPRKH